MVVDARVTDVDGSSVVGEDLALRVSTAAGSAEHPFRSLPSGRYQARVSADGEGAALLEVVTDDGRVIGERTVDVRSRPGGQHRWR
jgi:hypothetical protein